MLSFREIATSNDDADSLQTSLRELQRRRQAKQQRQQRERDAAAAAEEAEDEDGGFTAVQELAYSREVLHAWTRQYPKLRDVASALALASTSGASTTSSHPFHASDPAAETARPAFSVAGTVRRAYPPTWVIPPHTIPAALYHDNMTAMEDSLQLSSASSSPQRQPLASTSAFPAGGEGSTAFTVTTASASSHLHHLHSGRSVVGGGNAVAPAAAPWITDYSHRRCLVRVRREALQMPHTSDGSVSATPVSAVLSSWTPPASVASTSLSTFHQPVALQQQQRVLARWPPGKAMSAKISAVLRSIDIEARKREQWNAHVRKQLSPHEAKQTLKDAELECELGSSARDLRSPPSVSSYSLIQTNAVSPQHQQQNGTASRRGSLPALTEDNSGRELYWPAYVTNTRAVFTGAPCLHDNFHGLGLLQQYERFDAVLALALVSSLQIVVDVVYAIDETSEAVGLSIDPLVQMEGPVDAVQAGADGTKPPASRSLFPATPLATPRARRSTTAAETSMRDGAAAAEEAAARCPLLLPSTLPFVISDLNYSFHRAPHNSGNTDARRRHTSATASPQALLQQQEDVNGIDAPTATLRRGTLSTAPLSAFALLAGPVSQSHTIVLLRPTAEVVCAARARALRDLELRWQRLRQALVDRLVAYEEEAPVPVVEHEGEDESSEPEPLVHLPDADSYMSPFIDHSARPDDGLPEEPAGAAMLTEEEVRRQTRLPDLQGWHRKQQQNHHKQQSAATTGAQSLHKASGGDGAAPPPPVPSRSVSPQPAGRGAGGLVDPTASALRGAAPPLQSRQQHQQWPASSLLTGRSEVSLRSEEDGATARSPSPQAARLPARRRSSHETVQPYTPRRLPSAHRNERSEASCSSFIAGMPAGPHRDDVSAPTQQPRSLADPLPARMDLSGDSTAVSADLTVEESRVLSAAVRAAAARQTALEEAIRSLQKPLAMSRPTLPSRTVEAPSPASAETSATASLSRKEAPHVHQQQQQQQQRSTTNVLDITNTSAIAPSTALGSSPRSPPFPSALVSNTHDFSPMTWEMMETAAAAMAPRTAATSSPGKPGRSPPPQQQQQQQQQAREEKSCSRDGPGRVGEIGVSDASSLQTTPPSAHRAPWQRFNERGELTVPSLSTSGAAGTATTTPATAFAAGAAAGASSPAASFSTPPPPAPPSHSGSPSPRDVVVCRKEPPRPPVQPAQQRQQQHRPLVVKNQRNSEEAQHTQSNTARQLLTPSYHPSIESSSVDEVASLTALNPGTRTAAVQGPRSHTQSPPPPPQPQLPERFVRTTTTHRGEALSAVADGEGRETPSDASTASTYDTETETPQLRRTAAFSSGHGVVEPQTKTAAAAMMASSPPPPPPAATTQPPSNITVPIVPTSGLVRPSFSPACSTSPANTPRQQEQHRPIPTQTQSPQPSSTSSRKAGVPRSPRSLAASAAAAALASALAATSAATSATISGSGSHHSRFDEDHRLSAAHLVLLRDASPFYNRGYAVVDVGEEFGKEVGDAVAVVRVGGVVSEAQQDSPLPRRPSPGREGRVPALARAPTAPRAHTVTGSDNIGNSSAAALSSSVTREVELPTVAVATSARSLEQRRLTPQAVQQQQQQQQRRASSPTAALAMPHRAPQASAAATALYNLGNLDDAELVRLYELLYRQPNAEGATTGTRGGDAAVQTGASLHQVTALREPGAVEGLSGRGKTHDRGRVNAIQAAEEGQQEHQQRRDTPTSPTRRSAGHRSNRRHRHHSRHRHHHNNSNSNRDEKLLSHMQRPASTRSHHSRRPVVPASRSESAPVRHDSSSRSGSAGGSSGNPMAPTAVPPLRLQELRLPPTPLEELDTPISPSPAPGPHHDHCRRPKSQKSGDSEEDERAATASQAVRRGVVARLVSPLSSRVPSASSSRRSAASSAASSPSARRASPAAVVARTAHDFFAAPRDQQQQQQRRHSAQGSPPALQKTVLVRRVVRRRRSEVFVEEGGSLVSRAPMELRGSSHAAPTASPSRASSRTRSSRRKGQEKTVL